MKTPKQLKSELASFQGLWDGGTNLAKMGWKRTAKMSTNVDYNGIYRECIEPYVNPETVVLEIGCGGGGWTQRMVNAKQVICFDALSAKHNKFWKRVGIRGNVKYFQVKDFLCNEIEDASIDHVFSYDVFCHISYSGTREYLKNLYPKMKKGANAFIMIADADKYTDPSARKKQAKVTGFKTFEEVVRDYDGDNKGCGGRWFFYGLERFCVSLEAFGYDIIKRDMDLDKLSPIVHFRKS